MGRSKIKLKWFEKISIYSIAVLFAFFMGTIGYKLYDLGYLNKSGRSVPVYFDIPDFKLIERSGKEIKKADLLGHVWIADFIFTRCAGQCPIMNLAMSKLAQELPKGRFLSFTSDPEYDSPQVLATYATWYNADPERWLFLTGAKKTLNEVAAGFKLSGIDEPLMHSNYFLLIDKKGRIRGYYDPNEPEKLNALKKDWEAIQ